MFGIVGGAVHGALNVLAGVGGGSSPRHQEEERHDFRDLPSPSSMPYGKRDIDPKSPSVQALLNDNGNTSRSSTLDEGPATEEDDMKQKADPPSPSLQCNSTPIRQDVTHDHDVDVLETSLMASNSPSLEQENTEDTSSSLNAKQYKVPAEKGQRPSTNPGNCYSSQALTVYSGAGESPVLLSQRKPVGKDADGGQETSIPMHKRDINADMAVNETSESLSSTAFPNVLDPYFSTELWTTGLRFCSGKTIFAIRAVGSKLLLKKGKRGIHACLIYAQTRPDGPFELYSRRQKDGGSRIVDLLLEMGHEATLSAAGASAMEGRPRNIEIPGGCRGDASQEASALMIVEDDDGVRRSSNSFCVADSAYNLIKAKCPELLQRLCTVPGEDGKAITCDLGIALRLLVGDGNGSATTEHLIELACGCKELPFLVARVTDKNFRGVRHLKQEEKRDHIIELSKDGHMFVIQCVSRYDSSSTHYVGLWNGQIYDNDLETGGKIDAKLFVDDYLLGVKKVVEVIPCPPSSKKKKNKKEEKKRKREP